MLGTSAFWEPSISDTAKFRIRLFINFTGSQDVVGGAGTKWQKNWQTPNTTNFPDISDFLSGSFRLSGSAQEGVLDKDITRKLNFNLKNANKEFDYKVFDTYNPTLFKFNGTYDSTIFTKTGKKVGNIRSGRLVVFQVGVYDEDLETWNYIDKFRGRIVDWQVSQNDRQVQVQVEDESYWKKQVKSESDFYFGQTFEYIFRDQCTKHLFKDEIALLSFDPINDVIVSDIPYVFSFVYIPDLADTIWGALKKMAEIVAAKIEINELGQMVCFSRLCNGDDPYAFPGAEDAYRIMNNDNISGINDILSTSSLFNQNIINQVNIKSQPLRLQDAPSLVWKFKVYFNDALGRNEGYLKPNRYFGDVWAVNQRGSKDGGPVKAIDRSGSFNTGGQNQLNKTYNLTISGTPSGGFVQITIQDVEQLTPPFSLTAACDGVTETHLYTVPRPELANVYIILEEEAKLALTDPPYQAELQIGIVYYAEFGDFQVLPNDIATAPADSQITFELKSALYPDWTDELTASTADNGGPGGYSDRIVMALAGGETNWDSGNVFFKSTMDGSAWKRVKLLFVNRDSVPRYLKSFEISGRRIVQSKNINCTITADPAVVSAFGGIQKYEIENNLIQDTGFAQVLGRFIADNYSVPRDIPNAVIKAPRLYLQVGDRVKIEDNYLATAKEYIIRNCEETYSLESITQNLSFREADTQLYDISESLSSFELGSNEPLSLVGDSVDVGFGNMPTAGVRPPAYYDCDIAHSIADDSEYCINNPTSKFTVYDNTGLNTMLAYRTGDISGLRAGKDSTGAWLPNISASTIGTVLRKCYITDDNCNAILTPDGVEGARVRGGRILRVVDVDFDESVEYSSGMTPGVSAEALANTVVDGLIVHVDIADLFMAALVAGFELPLRLQIGASIYNIGTAAFYQFSLYKFWRLTGTEEYTHGPCSRTFYINDATLTAGGFPGIWDTEEIITVFFGSITSAAAWAKGIYLRVDSY